jgi:ABC-type lipoprotein release transport system permease subunit
MNLKKMAWRNLWRRKRRTLITAGSVGFGFLLAYTFTAMGDYIYTNMIDTSAKMGFGHVTVEPAGYNDSPALDKRLGNARVIRERTLKIPNVRDAIVRITGQAMFASASKNIGGIFMAIDPSDESAEWNVFIGSMVEGKVFKGPGGRGIVVGKKMAEKLNLGIGKKVVYTTTDVTGELVSEMARVTGIFKTGVDEVDGSVALLPIDSVRAVLGYSGGEATMVSIFINDQRRSEKVRDAVKAATAGHSAEALTWSETQPDMAGYVTIDKGFNYLFQLLVGLMIAAGILNTMLMSVLERTREFGIMMAIGMSPGKLFRLVIIESFYIGVIGLLIGIAVTIPAHYYLATVGIDLGTYIEQGADISGVLLDPVLKIRFYWESAAVILFVVFVLTLSAGLYPAYRAGRVPPVESLKTM